MTGQATTIVEIEDPYERGARLKAKRVLSDFISREHANRRIDNAQKAAADKFYMLRVTTMSNGLSSPSFAREYVDSSGPGDQISDRVINAFKTLDEARQTIGKRAYDAIDQCVCEGLTPTAIQNRNGKDRKLIAGYIKDGLEDLARLWNFA